MKVSQKYNMWTDASNLSLMKSCPALMVSAQHVFLWENTSFKKRCLYCSIVTLIWEGLFHTQTYHIHTHYFMETLLCISACFSPKWFTALSRKLCTYLHQHFLEGIPIKGCRFFLSFFICYLFFSLGHFSLLFATFWSKNLYFAEFWS